MDVRKTPIRDVMSTDVVVLNASATLAEGIETLRDYSVSGAPVVDDAGECVGVFTLADLARRDAEGEEGEAPRVGSYFNFGLTEKLALPDEEVDRDSFDRETIGDWMTPSVKWIPLIATAGDAATVMSEEGIHRVLVMDGAKIRGIVTSLDLARLLADTKPASSKPRRAKKAARSGTRRKTSRA